LIGTLKEEKTQAFCTEEDDVREGHILVCRSCHIRSKPCIIVCHPDTEIVGLNPTRGTDISVLPSMFVFFVNRDLAMGDFQQKDFYQMSVNIFRNHKIRSVRTHWSVHATEEQKGCYKIALRESPINFLFF
jgi:hypothetical protein